MINIVVSRYKKDTSWTEKFNKYDTNIMIYDKENPNNEYNVPINRGNEASVYLKYIIDNYENLTEYTFFVHDEEYSWHYTGSIIERFLEAFYFAITKKEKFYNINNYCLEPYVTAIDNKKSFHLWYNKFIEPYIPYESIASYDWMLGYKGCAQFLVHKDVILNFPLKFYQDIYNWILYDEEEHVPYMSGYYLEWTWHLFWVIYPNILKQKST
jgi:hypothetical protein